MLRRLVMTTATLLALAMAPGRAWAQAPGVRAGVSGDPNQFYLGVHVQTPPVFDQVRFRPNVEVGLGDDLVLVALNLDLVWRVPIRNHPWSLLVGGGPAANFFNHSERSETEVRGGLTVLVGLEHNRGFFTELKVGLIDSPSVKFGIGYTF